MIKDKVLGKKWRVYTTIDGNACNEGQRIGYCWSEIHRGYLTKNLIKEHQCIEKKCKHFQKYENADYWKQKEKRKAEKKKAKDKEKQIKQTKEDLLVKIRELSASDNNFFPISVEKEKNYYVIRFVRFEYVDIYKYKTALKSLTLTPFTFYEIKTNYENKLNILRHNNLNRNV